MSREKLRAQVFVNLPVGEVVPGGATHIGRPEKALCGRGPMREPSEHGYASCRACIKAAGYELPQPINLDEFNSLVREHLPDVEDWSWAITAQALDESGMPLIHYPSGSTYERLLAALARVI